MFDDSSFLSTTNSAPTRVVVEVRPFLGFLLTRKNAPSLTQKVPSSNKKASSWLTLKAKKIRPAIV
ncbi:hypothetical protein KKD60_01870, partial [Patescibacteria group bacterium]|nr:hypothetical protein [Patescibacteria group bacterium]